MLVDRYEPEDVFAWVPEVAQQTDPVLKTLDQLLEDDQLYKRVREDLGKRYRYTLVHGRHFTPVEVILRRLLCKHLYGWSYEVILIQKNGDYEVEASFTENEVASSNATGLTYCNVEWKQQPDKRRK